MELLGVRVNSGVPLEIARGCIKFARNDACSFCSIQYGAFWKNQVSNAELAWESMSLAVSNGYDYLYLTADELPLTFLPLLKQMAEDPPAWWSSISESQRPVVVGYARADGIADSRRAALLRTLGIRQVMIGIGCWCAHIARSYEQAVGGNKFLWESHKRAARMFQQNIKALEVARHEDLLVRVGFVLGHLGMTSALLEENVRCMCEILHSGRDVISALDVEVLSPQPGSRDFSYLCDPALALTDAVRLGLEIVPGKERDRIANEFLGNDIVDREMAMESYVRGLMPGVSMQLLADARNTVRSSARACGIVVGEAE